MNTITLSGPDAGLFSAKTKAPFNVAPMGSVVVAVSFSPTTIGMFNATLTLTTDDMNLPMASIPLTGAGTAAGFAAAPLNLDFGSIPVGETSPSQKVTLSNTGNQPLIISSFFETGADANDFNIDTPPAPNAMIAPGGKLSFNVTFTPAANQIESAQVNISTNDPKNPSVTLRFDGFGTQPMLSVSPMATLDFKTVQVGAKSAPQAVTLQNIGDADLHISTIKVVGAMGGPFSTDSPGALVIGPNKAIKVNVTFAPTMAVMSMAALEIDSSDASVLPVQIMMMGTGVSPMVSASPATIDFGPIPSVRHRLRRRSPCATPARARSTSTRSPPPTCSSARRWPA